MKKSTAERILRVPAHGGEIDFQSHIKRIENFTRPNAGGTHFVRKILDLAKPIVLDGKLAEEWKEGSAHFRCSDYPDSEYWMVFKNTYGGVFISKGTDVPQAFPVLNIPSLMERYSIKEKSNIKIGRDVKCPGCRHWDIGTCKFCNFLICMREEHFECPVCGRGLKKKAKASS